MNIYEIEHNREIVHPNTRMADVIEADYRILPLLYRIGIELGFGEKSISEVCCESGINPNSFLLICNTYLLTDYSPSSELIGSANPSDLIKYLSSSHSYYLNECIRELEGLIDKVASDLPANQRDLITTFYKVYRKELENHFSYEEDIVFPYVRRVIEHKEENEKFTIGTCEKNHSNVDEKINDLKSIVMKYIHSTGNRFESMQLLSTLYILERDLMKHTFIEDHILIPMINLLEQSHDSQ